MTRADLWWRWQGEDLILTCHVQPRASHEAVRDVQEGRLRVALTAPPVEGAANQALCRMIAKKLGVPKGDVRVVQGESSREKVICVGQCLARLLRKYPSSSGTPPDPVAGLELLLHR